MQSRATRITLTAVLRSARFLLTRRQHRPCVVVAILTGHLQVGVGGAAARRSSVTGRENYLLAY
jgi:hypothetical protein